jgi:hypothetical protein
MLHSSQSTDLPTNLDALSRAVPFALSISMCMADGNAFLAIPLRGAKTAKFINEIKWWESRLEKSESNPAENARNPVRRQGGVHR